MAGRNLDGRVVTINGLRIAGPGGNFQGAVWHPWQGEPRWPTRADFIASMGKGNRPPDGGRLPLKKRGAIWYEDYQALAAQRADVLVTHEAPGCHPHGFFAIDELAAAMGAQLIIHGHVHVSYRFDYADRDLQVIGVGQRGVSDANGRVIVPGDLDGERVPRLIEAHQTDTRLPRGSLTT